MTQPNQPTLAEDVALMQRLAARDQAALAEIYDRYAGWVFGMAVRVLGDSASAEEVTQDVFLKLWHAPDRWQPQRGRLATWLLTLARHSAIDRLRHERRQAPAPALDLDALSEMLGAPSETEQEGWLSGEALRPLIDQLPPEQRHALDLAYFKGMTQSEIAAHLREPLGTIKSRIRLGLITLRGLWMRAE